MPCDESTEPQQTKICVQADPTAVACLKQGTESDCSCLRNASAVQNCLHACWPLVEESLCASERSDLEAADAVYSRTGACDPTTVAAQTKTCVQADPLTIECLKSGTEGDCSCLSKSAAVQDCLGGCWNTVRKSLCADEPTAPVAMEGVCDKATVAATTKACVQADPTAVACLKSGTASDCVCLRTSASARSCLGGCWLTVEESLCADEPAAPDDAAMEVSCDTTTVADTTKDCVQNDPNAVACLRAGTESDCSCIRKSAAVQDCLGGCWNTVEESLCVDERAKATGSATACDESTVPQQTKICVQADPTAVVCLKLGTESDCRCLRKASAVQNCLHACWPLTDQLNNQHLVDEGGGSQCASAWEP